MTRSAHDAGAPIGKAAKSFGLPIDLAALDTQSTFTGNEEEFMS
jgi:hypothetical protein